MTFANGEQGYLPAAGELQAWYDNKTTVNACMDAIGADNVYVSTWNYTWSSTQYSASSAWYWNYSSSDLYNFDKNCNYYARPVSAFSL